VREIRGNETHGPSRTPVFDVDLTAAELSLRAAHARFLKQHRDVLVTFGPIRRADGAPAGYAYQTDFPGTTADTMHCRWQRGAMAD
jgi:hypothetical protein